MGWLDDIARRRVTEKRDSELEYKAQKADALREVKKARRMVVSVLEEVGRAYWASVREPWEIHVLNSGLTSERWSVRHYRYRSQMSWDCWEVSLSSHGTARWHFNVECKDDCVSTNDTSEAELRRCIKIAVERGPKGDSY